MRFLFVLVVLGGVLSAPVYAQEKMSFDLASIRPSNASPQFGSIKPLPGGYGYMAQNVSAKVMISLMYRIPMRQIEGAPDWLGSERFDVEAKADHAYGTEELRGMYRNLLAERFGLKFHMVNRPGNVYALTVDKDGLKMKKNDSPEDYLIPVNFTPSGSAGRRVPMPYLCWFLGQQLQDDERPVVDQTGLTGNYDFNLSFKPQRRAGDADETDDRPSIFDALRSQLGLKLVPQKGEVPYMVIEGIHKPSEN